MKLRIGARGSALSRAQAGDIANRLEVLGHTTELVVISTEGDRVTDRAFTDVGAFGIFVREIETALLDGRIDVAVHSYKDLPSQSPDGLVVAAVPERADAADVLFIRPEAGAALDPLPIRDGARVGTSAARRQAFLRSLRPDLEIGLLRGNVPTRLQALADGRFDAIVLAAAGVDRLERITSHLVPAGTVRFRLDPAVFVPAPSQGAIAVQVRANDAGTRQAVAALDDAQASRIVRAERAALALAEGGCTQPFGAWCAPGPDGSLRLVVALGKGDGTISRADFCGDVPEDVAASAWQEVSGEVRVTPLPIAGRRILVTRAREESEAWAARLAALGAHPVVFPCLITEPIEDNATADVLRTELSRAQWLLVTSPRAATGVARLLGGAPDARVRIAVIGPATAEACAAAFGRIDFIAPHATSAALGEAVAQFAADAEPPHARAVIAGAAGGREEAEAALTARGVVVTRVDVYRTRPAPSVERRENLSAAGIDDVLLASPSAVTGLLNTALVPPSARVITIGPTTSGAATAAGLRVFAEAREPTLDGMLKVFS